MSHKLELLRTSGRFEIFRVVTVEADNSGALSGTTISTLDKSGVEARNAVVFSRGTAAKTKKKDRGEVRF